MKEKMNQFRFDEDFEPGESGPQLELKREFMDKYYNMFPEDELLYLAEAYANIYWMNYRYPEPVMRQIHHLAGPLQTRKRFQRSSNNSNMESAQNQKDGKMSVCHISERPFKQIKLSSTKAESQELKMPPASTSHSTTTMQSSPTLIPANIEPNSELASDDEDSEDENADANSDTQSSESKSEIQKYSKIVYALGIDFIQNFVQQLQKFQSKQMSPLDSIIKAAQTLRVMKFAKFKQYIDPKCLPPARMYCCRFVLKRRSIAFETGHDMKIVKQNCAKSAVDILMKITKLYSFSNENKSSIDSSQAHCSKVTDSNNSLQEDMIMLEKIGKSIPTAKMNVLFHAMKSLNIEQYILFRKSAGSASGCEWKLFYKNILLSTVSSGKRAKTGKLEALNAALLKLKNLSKYEIKNNELIKIEQST